MTCIFFRPITLFTSFIDSFVKNLVEFVMLGIPILNVVLQYDLAKKGQNVFKKRENNQGKAGVFLLLSPKGTFLLCVFKIDHLLCVTF